MKLILGLGNPEQKYTGTRHNIGFATLDAYAATHEVPFNLKEKFRASIAEVPGEEKVLLVKPTTYYNLVGESLRLITDFYKVSPNDILIVHDELSLPFGTIRARLGGSDAGNNGIKSVNAHGGTDTARLRVGISSELRARMGDVDFVLGMFSKDEQAALDESIIPKCLDMIDDFIAGQHEPTSHTL